MGAPALLVPGAGSSMPHRARLRRGSHEHRDRVDLGVNQVTVSKWRHRFGADRLDGLMDAPRPGAARTISDEVVEAVVVETLETAPPDATHWSTRSLAAKHGISRQTVSEIWRASASSPGAKTASRCPRPTARGEDRDLVALYMNPRSPRSSSPSTRSPDPGPRPNRADTADASHHTERATTTTSATAPAISSPP